MAGGEQGNGPEPSVDDRLVQLDEAQKQAAREIDRLRQRTVAGELGQVWFRAFVATAVPLVALFVNLATPFNGAASGFGSLSNSGPRGSGWLTLYVIIAVILAVALAIIGGSSPTSSPRSWYLVTVLAAVLVVLAIVVNRDGSTIDEARAGLRMAVVWPLLVGIISLLATSAVAAAQDLAARS